MDTTTENREFQVDIYLNETTTAEAAANGDEDCARLVRADSGYGEGLAIFSRLRRSAAARPGDRLRHVHTATVTAPSSLWAADVAFALGNGAHADSDAYYAHRIRSVSVGDVVVVHTPDGPAPHACQSSGWADVALADFEITEG
jgi:hypothetical protein